MTVNGYISNEECILDYLALFQNLSSQDADPDSCREHWNTIQLREEATPSSVPLAPQILRWKFELEELEFLLCMAALALEMDGGLRQTFRRQYGLQLPTLEYGLQLLEPLCPISCDVLAAFCSDNPLCGLLLTEPAQLPDFLMEYPLLLCRQILSFLTGLDEADTPGCSCLIEERELWLPFFQAQLLQMRSWEQNGAAAPLYLLGAEGSGRKSLALRCFQGMVYGELKDLNHLSRLQQAKAIREMAVLSRLTGLPLCIKPGTQDVLSGNIEDYCEKWNIPLIFTVEEQDFLPARCEVVRLPRYLTSDELRIAWQTFAPCATAQPTGSMTIGTVRQIAELADRFAKSEERKRINRQDIQKALHQRSRSLPFGIQYEPKVSLGEMVLPPSVLQQLELICQAAKSGPELSEWGLPQYREGVTAVFHGPSGTGKTMAAQAIAHALGLPMLRADLSSLMDKYVGETEKHLAQLFQGARENHCLLLFDEADSLFGKRSGISNGQDKYANLSASFLLQEIEQYDGTVILSTNLLNNFDNAFLRRIRYVVRFGLPELDQREELWQKAIPEKRRQGILPFKALAQAELSPARINGTVYTAAVSALAQGRHSIGSADITRALKLELEKSGKSTPRGMENLLKE